MIVPMTTEVQHCIDACRQCVDASIEATMHCLNCCPDEEHLRPFMDCADLCNACGNLLRRRSPMSWRLCDVCADSCEQCADICERYPQDETMVRCGAACRECSDACRKIGNVVAKAA